MAEWVCSLPMYDVLELREVTDAWWAGLAGHFRQAGVESAPKVLTRPGEGQEFWMREDCLFSQTCGYPLATALKDRVSLLGTPCYCFTGCDGPYYSSVVIVRSDSEISDIDALRGRRCVINMRNSWSGNHALRLLVAPLAVDGPVWSEVIESGAHRASIDMVRFGIADVASIDCVTFGLLSRHVPATVDNLRVLCRTGKVPGLPFIAGNAVDSPDLERLRSGLHSAFADPGLSDVRSALGLTGIEPLHFAEYRPLATFAVGAGG